MQKQAREVVQKDILQLQNCCLEIAEKKKKKKDWRFLLYFSAVFSLYKEVLIFLFLFPALPLFKKCSSVNGKSKR